MMTEAGQLIADAHANGLLVVLWIYPRGKAVADEKDAHLIAGAAGTAACLGADFVKCNPPKGDDTASSAEKLIEASQGLGPHRAGVCGRLDRRRDDVPRPSSTTRSTWAAPSATRPAATSTSARSTRLSG